MKSLKERLHDTFDYSALTGLLTRKLGRFAGHVQTATDHKNYLVTYFEGKTHRVHRVIWAMHHGEWPNGQIDHIDGDRSNNRVSNLRVTDATGNARNRRSNASKMGKPKGVWLNDIGTYCAEIYTQNKRHYLGCYQTLDEAAHAYNKAAIQMHGEFACINPVGA